MILIKNCAVLPMTSPDDYIDKGYIAVKGSRIEAVGAGQPPDEEHFSEVIDGTGMVALPGLVNAHTHAAMTLMRGYGDDLPLMEWLQEKIWPIEDKLTPEDCYWGALLGITEMIKSGTTCFADMYFYMEEVARAVEETGIRASLSQGMVALAPTGEAAFQKSRELFKWHGRGDGRITVMLGPHAPYTCTPDYLKRVMSMADELGIGIHIHLAETMTEYNDIKAQYGKTPIALMEEIGLFERPVLAAHCVVLDDEDIEILARRKVGVAHNPESNMKLASGAARVPDMLAAGVLVALGTDGASSNNNLDMIQEIRSCCFMHKLVRLDPRAVTAYQALEMATVNGARALGLEDVGVLYPGMKADLILVDFRKPHLCPRNDVAAHLAYSAAGADVDTVMVDGRILMRGRQLMTIDEEMVMRQVEDTVAGFFTR
ncbi:MAG: amidohydrolase [Syntrophomonadales bacterium]|jgi:5-methylthioadenosine/S-adenosylhomocysteine deaminase